MSGRPTKPEELRRLEGFPDHRPPRQPTLIGGRLTPEDLAGMHAPAGMGADERRAWHEITAPLVAGGIVDRADLPLIELAAQSLARVRQARRQIAATPDAGGGLIVTTPQGRIANPAIGIERGAMAEYRQLAAVIGQGAGNRARLGKPAGAKPDGGMAGELGRTLGSSARDRLRVVGGGDAD